MAHVMSDRRDLHLGHRAALQAWVLPKCLPVPVPVPVVVELSAAKVVGPTAEEPKLACCRNSGASAAKGRSVIALIDSHNDWHWHWHWQTLGEDPSLKRCPNFGSSAVGPTTFAALSSSSKLLSTATTGSTTKVFPRRAAWWYACKVSTQISNSLETHHSDTINIPCSNFAENSGCS
jgi:hypothetical protein